MKFGNLNFCTADMETRLDSKSMHFLKENIISGGIEPFKKCMLCCRMHVARGPLLTLWFFLSPPLGPSPGVADLVLHRFTEITSAWPCVY